MRLRRPDDGGLITLAAQHRVGRSRSANLRLDLPAISAEHALIAWDGASWVVRDLSSRNGTFCNAQRLLPHERYALSVGDRLRFGHDTVVFDVVDALPPVAMAEDDAGTIVLAEHGVLALPDGEDAEVAIFEDGERGFWLERLQGDRVQREPALDQTVVVAGGRGFRLYLPEPLRETAASSGALELARLTLEFVVSSDEEDVSLRLVQGALEKELPPRSFQYVLLVLGRLRLADVDASEGEAGWVDVERLLRMLKTTRRQLNLAVFRARQQLAEAGVQGAGELVERRPQADRLRLSTARVRERRR